MSRVISPIILLIFQAFARFLSMLETKSVASSCSTERGPKGRPIFFHKPREERV